METGTLSCSPAASSTGITSGCTRHESGCSNLIVPESVVPQVFSMMNSASLRMARAAMVSGSNLAAALNMSIGKLSPVTMVGVSVISSWNPPRSLGWSGVSLPNGS